MPAWKGDAALPHSGRARARAWYPTLGLCAECEVSPATERHHWDGNTLNNTPTNVVPLCSRCHLRIDGRLAANVARLPAMLAAANQEKRARTHCKHGHPFTPENTYIKANGTRACRICRQRWKKEHRERKRNAP